MKPANRTGHLPRTHGRSDHGRRVEPLLACTDTPNGSLGLLKPTR
ncbi:MAG: hypothetical protein ACI9CA_002224 [Natronomonas sp.]|jgi:hypothetical protein